MGVVLVNGTIRKPGFRLLGGENIKVELPDENPVPEMLKPENIPLKIVFEDDAIVVAVLRVSAEVLASFRCDVVEQLEFDAALCGFDDWIV